MLGSLRARLIVSFALVVAWRCSWPGRRIIPAARHTTGGRPRALRPPDGATDIRYRRAHVGRTPIAELESFIKQRSNEYGARIMLVDQDQVVVYDTEDNELLGRYVLAFEGTEVQQDESRGLRYWWADFDSEDDLTLFMSQTRPGEDGTFAAPQYSGGDRDPPGQAGRGVA